MAAAVWDAHATLYEQIFERSTWLWGRDAFTLAAFPDVRAHAPPLRLLDVACGSGQLALTAADRGFDVTATDWSAGMIARLQRKIASESVKSAYYASRIKTMVADGQTLADFADASFDVVTSIFGIFLFPDRCAAWTSALRVLKPGGRLLATSWDANIHILRLVPYVLENATDLPTVHANQTAPSTLLAPAANKTLLATTFSQELEESGFRDVSIYTVGHDFCFTSGEEFVKGFLDNGLLGPLIVSKDPESVKLAILQYCQQVLDGQDPFAEETHPPSSVFVPRDGHRASDRPLWTKPFALPARAHIAIATKCSS